jgi:hypothetical protein
MSLTYYNLAKTGKGNEYYIQKLIQSFSRKLLADRDRKEKG